MCIYPFAGGTSVNTITFIVCRGQTGKIHCPRGSFVYIQEAVYGHNENLTQQDPTEECLVPSGLDTCDDETSDFVPFTTKQSIPNIQVPHGNVTCPNGRERPINYAQIEFMCIPGIINIRCI